MTDAAYQASPGLHAEIDDGLVGDITDIQSYTWILNDWIFNTLKNDPFFVNFKIMRIVQALPVEAWSQTPFLGIFLAEEKLQSYGPFNMTNINLTHRVPIGFQIILQHNDPETLLKYLDRTSWHIMKY